MIDKLGGSKAQGYYPVSRLCEFFDRSTQAYYKNRHRSNINHTTLITTLCTHALEQRKQMPSVGCRKIHATLDKDWPYGRDKTERMLIDLGFRVGRKRNRTKTTYAGSVQLPNLIKGLKINGLNQVWQSDMTYYFMQNGKVAYLIFIVDVYSQHIIAHGAFLHYPATVFVQVLRRAFHTRQGHCLQGTIHHSDYGSQYGSELYRATLATKQIVQSMCKYSWENPYAEKVNDIIKNGYLSYWNPSNYKMLLRMLNKAVKTHNHKQAKAALNMKTPIAFEHWIQRLPLHNRPVKTLKPIKCKVTTYEYENYDDL